MARIAELLFERRAAIGRPIACCSPVVKIANETRAVVLDDNVLDSGGKLGFIGHLQPLPHMCGYHKRGKGWIQALMHVVAILVLDKKLGAAHLPRSW